MQEWDIVNVIRSLNNFCSHYFARIVERNNEPEPSGVGVVIL